MDQPAGRDPPNLTGTANKPFPAAQAEADCREEVQRRLSDVKLQVGPGVLNGLTRWWVQLQQRGCWLDPVCDDPVHVREAGLDQYYKRGQRFYVHHPMVSWGVSAVQSTEAVECGSPAICTQLTSKHPVQWPEFGTP